MSRDVRAVPAATSAALTAPNVVGRCKDKQAVVQVEILVRRRLLQWDFWRFVIRHGVLRGQGIATVAEKDCRWQVDRQYSRDRRHRYAPRAGCETDRSSKRHQVRLMFWRRSRAYCVRGRYQR